MSEARTWRADAAVAVRKGALRATTPVTVADAARAFLDGAADGTILTNSGRSYKSNTLRGYSSSLRLHVLPDLGARRLADVSSADVQDLVRRLLASGLGANAIQNSIMPLRVIYRRAIDHGDVSVNPTTGVKVPRLRRVPVEALSPEEIVTPFASHRGTIAS